MKLLLANGTTIPVASYNTSNCTLNGDTVPTIELCITGQTLNSVRTVFSAEENLTQFNIYDNKNKLLLSAIGYQTRIGIAIGDDDSSYIVTLAKASEASQMVKCLEEKVINIAEVVEDLRGVIEEATSRLSEVTSSIGTYTTDQNMIVKKIDSMSEGLNSAISDVGTLKQHYIELAQQMKEVSTGYQNTVKVLSNTTSIMEGLNNFVKETNEKASTVMNDNHNLSLVLNNQKETISSLAKSYDETNEMVLKHDESQTDIKKQVESISDDTSKMSKSITELELNKINVDREIGKQNKKQESIAEDVQTLAKDLQDTTLAAKNTAKELSDIDLRVTNLEPISDITTLSLEDAKIYRINESKQLLEEFLAAHPITSTCHQDKPAQYSITSEKSTLLLTMISMTEMCEASGVPYQPSWNATGQSCTYDWTLQELKQLALEIEQVVRPLISYQQHVEEYIQSVENMEALTAVIIDYNPVYEETLQKIAESLVGINKDSENSESTENKEDGSTNENVETENVVDKNPDGSSVENTEEKDVSNPNGDDSAEKNMVVEETGDPVSTPKDGESESETPTTEDADNEC